MIVAFCCYPGCREEAAVDYDGDSLHLCEKHDRMLTAAQGANRERFLRKVGASGASLSRPRRMWTKA